MHDSPQYAFLQTLSRIHAECQQRIDGLEAYIRLASVPTPCKSRLSTIIQKTKQLFATAETGAILNSYPIQNFDLSERRSIEMSWRWLTQGLESLSTGFANGDYSTAKIDVLIERIDEHLQSKTA